MTSDAATPPPSDAPARRVGSPLSAQARAVLGLVVLFTAAFVAVISIKITQEWRAAQAQAEVSQARAAAFLSERVARRMAAIHGAADGAARGLAADWAVDGSADIFGHLSGLNARADTRGAALIADDGRVRGATSAADGERLVVALAEREERSVWTAAPDGAPGVFVAADVQLGERKRVFVVEVEPSSLAPTARGDQLIAVIDASGAILAMYGEPAPDPGVDAATALGLSASEIADLSAGERASVREVSVPGVADTVIGGAPLGRSGLTVLIRGPLEIDRGAWRRTLLFYVLLLVAPLLVAVGLCAVLLMQMDNIRQARAALSDSERRFRLAIEGARCGVWDWNIGNDTVFITDSLARMLGKHQSGTVTGAEFLSLIRREDQERFKLAIRGAAGAKAVDVEFRAHGLPVWLHARGRPWTGGDGQHSGRIVGVAIDVTEQKGAQARVTAAETRLRAALESMSESFVLWDARRRLVLSNQKYREFFHLDERLVKHGATYEMLEMASQGAIVAVHAGDDDDDANELELADGRWVHLSERRTRDGGLVSIGTDITALKRQESQLVDNEKRLRNTVVDLRKAQERLADLARKYEQEKIRAEDANRSKSEFLANMSHELRTPLNAINGFSEIMQEEMFGELGDPRYKEYVGDILSSGQHLLALINDILDMSKIEAGKLRLSPETVYPDEVAEQCARLMRGKAKDAQLQLILDVDDLPEIECDPRALKQVLLNLLTNAIKFSEDGGRVELRGRAQADGVAFEVADDGIGIAEVDLPRLGRPFEQIEHQHSKSHQGSGLGLALSKSLIEMHGGSFAIASALGRGTTVTFTLPRTPVIMDDDSGVALPAAAPFSSLPMDEPMDERVDELGDAVDDDLEEISG